MIRLYKYKGHVIFWACYILYVYLLEIWNDPNEKFLDILFANTSSISTFYISLLAYKLIDRKKWILGCACFIFSFICCWIVRYIYWHYLLALIDVKPFTEYEFGIFTRIVIRVFIIFSLYALGYFYAQRSIEKQKKLRIFEKQQAETEKAKLEVENKNLKLNEDFLRAQINPHFLYNCLNLFYSETFEKLPEVGEGIIMLAQIMRYSLNDYSENNGLTELSEEIEHIENVINIHQKRFVNSLNISIKVEGNREEKLIAPMILITMVENVFKHGDLHDKNYPAEICCSINEIEQKVYFTTYNKKSKGPKEPSTGIGLNNIKQRLQSLYKDNFSITTDEDANIYKKEIAIPYFSCSNQADISTETYNQVVC